MQKYLVDIEDVLIYACSFIAGSIIGKVILNVAVRTLGF